MEFLLLIFSVKYLIGSSLAANQFLLTKWENCHNNLSIMLNMDLSNTEGVANKMVYSGSIEITREVRGPAELWIEVNRCDLDMKNCQRSPIQKFDGICKKLRDKKAFYYDSLMSIHPPLHCPFTPQNYTATNSTIDLMGISFLPLSDCLWMTTCKLYVGEPKKQELVMCTELEMKILRVNSRRKKPKSG